MIKMASEEKLERLDCLLISPPIFYENSKNIWKEINSNFPPLGLASIAGHIRNKGYPVRIIDCNIVSPSIESFEPYFQENIKKQDKIYHYNWINCYDLLNKKGL